MSSVVFVLVRSADIRGCVEVRVFPTLESAKDYCVVYHKLPHGAWEPYLTKHDPDGLVSITEGGAVRQVRYVGWQQESHDESMMQIFEQHVRG